MEDEGQVVDEDVQEVTFEEADAPREDEDICLPIYGFHLNKCEFALNGSELSVQDVHLVVLTEFLFLFLFEFFGGHLGSRVNPTTRNSLIGPAIFVKLLISARIRLRTSVVVRSKVAHRHCAHRQRRLRSIARFPAKGARYSRHSLHHFCPHFSNLENA